MGLGTTEILIIAAVLILLFGAKKLPDLARGSGRALRIFKSETKGLMNDEDNPDTDPHGRPLPAGTQPAQQVRPPVAAPTATSAPAPAAAQQPQQQSQDGVSRDQQF